MADNKTKKVAIKRTEKIITPVKANDMLKMTKREKIAKMEIEPLKKALLPKRAKMPKKDIKPLKKTKNGAF
jgi:formate-dependent nitrite reductase cytochrome c552 subunit